MVERGHTTAAGGVFARSEQWLEKKYGKDRVVAAVVHRDEATPHLSAFVVPLTQDGRLSAKEFIGGRSKMREDQSTYAESVKNWVLSAASRKPRHASDSSALLRIDKPWHP